jgi:hypothetical protein
MQNISNQHICQWRTRECPSPFFLSTLKIGLHGFLQNFARLKNVCKKPSETSGGAG